MYVVPRGRTTMILSDWLVLAMRTQKGGTMLGWKRNGYNEVVGSCTGAADEAMRAQRIDVLCVNDITLYSIRSGIVSSWSVLRTAVMWWCLGGLSRSTGESILVGGRALRSSFA